MNLKEFVQLLEFDPPKSGHRKTGGEYIKSKLGGTGESPIPDNSKRNTYEGTIEYEAYGDREPEIDVEVGNMNLYEMLKEMGWTTPDMKQFRTGRRPSAVMPGTEDFKPAKVRITIEVIDEGDEF